MAGAVTEKNPSRSGLKAFRSSGLHVLETYVSTSATDSSATVRTEDGSARLTPTPSRVWTGHIPADNVGFRLLRKAGWNVGSGLGADEQGRREPIAPIAPKGTRGLGFDSEAARQQQQERSTAEGQRQLHGRKRGAAEAVDDPDRSAKGGPTANDRVAAIVQEELAGESLGAKVARHRQLMRTELEQERGRAIERYIRSAFNDPFDHLRSDNSNPLSRRHKLTESNPLLDPIGD